MTGAFGDLALAIHAMRRSPVLPSSTRSPAQRGGGGAPWSPSSGVPIDPLATQPVSREDALSVPAMHRGLDLISTTVASLPLRAYSGRNAIDSSDVGTFLAQPEPHVPRSVTLSRTVLDLIFDGVSYWRIIDRYSTGFPRWVERVAAVDVAIQSDWSARVRGEYLPLSDLVVFYGPDLNSAGMPVGILNTAARTVRTAIRLEEAAARYAYNEVPYGALTSDDTTSLDDPAIEKLLAAWETARRRRATAYLPQGLKWNPVSGPDPDKLQLSEARAYIASECARHLNLPPRYVGASVVGDSMTYESQSADRRDLLDLGVRPWLGAIETTLSMIPGRTDPRVAVVTPAGIEVAFDTAQFLLSDYSQRADFYSKVVPLGILTVDEARQIERLPERVTTGGE